MKFRMLTWITAMTLFAALAMPVRIVAQEQEQQKPVKMTFSGTNVATMINLQPGTVTDDEDLAGNGRLGQFTYRELHADALSPQPSSTCSGPNQFYFPTVTGAGVFRFQDGSLLTVRITAGGICVDFTAVVGHLNLTYQITGGTGRFTGASGTLTLTSTLVPVLYNASNAAQFLTNMGEFEGTVFGVAIGEEGQDERQ